MGKRKLRPSLVEGEVTNGGDVQLLPQVRVYCMSYCESSLSYFAFYLKKRFYRQRAHANPFSDHTLEYPTEPESFNTDKLYPAFLGSGQRPEFLDVGCGFGGLLVALAPLFPDTLILGKRYSPCIPLRS